MDDKLYDEVVIEKICKDRFGVEVDIAQMIVAGIGVSRTARASVFLSRKKLLFALVYGESKLLLGDVIKIVTRMGLKADLYFPPKQIPDYFDAIGREKFQAIFPGRQLTSSEDLIYYRTLAPYNPALALIKEVKNNEINQFDTYSTDSWRPAVKFAYRRIKTS